MAFKKEYIDYSDSGIVVNNVDYHQTSMSEAWFTWDGKQYMIRSYRNNYYPWAPHFDGLPKAEAVEKQILYTIKAKNKDIYILWCLIGGAGYIYINNQPNLENALNIYVVYSSAFNEYDGSYVVSLYENKITLVFQYYAPRESKWFCESFGLSVDDIVNFMGAIDGKTFSPSFGGGSESGGYDGGTFDNTSDTIPIPNTPQIGVTNVGFINVYKPNINALVNLGDELFPDFESVPIIEPTESISDVLRYGFNNFNNLLNDLINTFVNSQLINYVVDCHIMPISPTVTEDEHIKIGFKSFTPSAPRVNSDYVDFDCGIINIGEYYSNFIDYVGTRAKLYLPFIGFVPIENEFFQNGYLQVIYRFNVLDGSFMAYVLSSSSKSQLLNSVIAQYGGNACVHLPITGINYANMLSGLVTGSVASMGVNTSQGTFQKAPSTSVSVDVGNLASNAMNTLANKPSMQSSNGYNSTSAFLGIRYPYLIIEREVASFSTSYANENALPSNINKTISELSGFVQMDNIHMDSLHCMDIEKDMIRDLLVKGIII